jgi:hypothetical protein
LNSWASVHVHSSLHRGYNSTAAPTSDQFTALSLLPLSMAHNVLLIVVDDLRPNLAAHGSKFMVTPHMDALAASGVLFQRAYAQYSLCGPSRTS